MASNTINLTLTFDGKEANASIRLMDESIRELYKSFKYGQTEANGLTASISRGFNNAREILQGFKEVYSALDTVI
ncbi:MAG TPA: hypothetical protein VHP30_06695, partial [Ignavibacteriales bacterium]|nr:hypothetical protein [Ignavibacteriales bacterium]